MPSFFYAWSVILFVSSFVYTKNYQNWRPIILIFYIVIIKTMIIPSSPPVLTSHISLQQYKGLRRSDLGGSKLPAEWILYWCMIWYDMDMLLVYHMIWYWSKIIFKEIELMVTIILSTQSHSKRQDNSTGFDKIINHPHRQENLDLVKAVSYCLAGGSLLLLQLKNLQVNFDLLFHRSPRIRLSMGGLD